MGPIAGFHGEQVVEGAPGYDEARAVFNAMVDRRPALIARCTSTGDVALAIDHARRTGLPVAVRAGGHSVAGQSLNDGGIVIDVRSMAEVTVDAQRRIARCGGGAIWAEFDRRTQAFGLATTGGRVSTTGVAGLTLGGGSGWIERRFGLSCDNLAAIEMVTAAGDTARATEDENARPVLGHARRRRQLRRRHRARVPPARDRPDGPRRARALRPGGRRGGPDRAARLLRRRARRGGRRARVRDRRPSRSSPRSGRAA